MPAASDGGEPSEVPVLPHTWRPLGARVMSILLLVALFGLCGFTWWALGPEDRAKFTAFQIGTLIFVGLGILAVYYAVVRCRVTAGEDGLVVVNGYRRHDFAWAQIVAVSMPSGAPWVSLDLADGTTIAALGIQAADGRRARAAVAQLRTLVDTHST
jgi:hypothetical protein